MPSDLDIIQRDVLTNLQQLSLLQQLEVLRLTENLVKESEREKFDKKIKQLEQLDEWTKSLVGLIPTDDVTDESLKRDHQNYLEQKYQ